MNSVISKLGDVCTYCAMGAVVTAAMLMWVFTIEEVAEAAMRSVGW